MRTGFILTLGATLGGFLLIAIFFTHPLPLEVQRGYRGLGMVTQFDPRTLAVQRAYNQVPVPQDPIEPGGTPSKEVYENVQVLGDVDSDEFIRLMSAITEWVAPEQGCGYCHNLENLAEDSVYTKVVARKMLQMTMNINQNWKSHVGNVGVTCYTCHRGNPVPANVWFHDPGRPHARGMAGNPAGQNAPSETVGLASLPADPFTPFLEQANDIRVISKAPLPNGNRRSIKQTEWTYGLMMHMSQSLGVNCTYCHNSRSFAQWDQSTPARANAWYGIRMVRDTNVNYLASLQGVFPHERLGVQGDVAKTNCATCHQGVFKPLYGVSMVKDYPELAIVPAAVGTPPAPDPAGFKPAVVIPAP